MKNIEKPLVSIAIITYNQKSFLEECIESCLNQDYPNIEIVVADDGSTDGTHELLNEYSERYPDRFVLRLSKVNQGITKNSNSAHFACSGKYVAWMGGDDLMLPNKITKQVDYMERNPDCTICYHDLDVFDSDSGKTIYTQSKKVKPREGGLRTYIKYGVFNGACSSMVRAEKTPTLGFNEIFPVASDWCYWIDSLANGGEIRYIPEVLARYRRHSKNITKKKPGISQNNLDHLNTCNYALTKHPKHFKEAMHCYSRNIRSLRHELPYIDSLAFSIKTSLDIRSIFAAFLFIISAGKLKI